MAQHDEHGPKGAAGRRLPREESVGAASTRGPAPAAPSIDPRAPFAPHQADPATLAGASDQGPARRAPFVIAGATFVTALFGALVIAAMLAEGWATDGPVPAVVVSAPRHRTDASAPGPIVDDYRPPAPEIEAPPRPGPIKIYTSSDRGFVSIEVDCPSSRFQRRGRFFAEGAGTMAATVREVPPGEKCRITFQGTEAATTWAYAHETRTCTSFNPTVCPER